MSNSLLEEVESWRLSVINLTVKMQMKELKEFNSCGVLVIEFCCGVPCCLRSQQTAVNIFLCGALSCRLEDGLTVARCKASDDDICNLSSERFKIGVLVVSLCIL